MTQTKKGEKGHELKKYQKKVHKLKKIIKATYSKKGSQTQKREEKEVKLNKYT